MTPQEGEQSLALVGGKCPHCGKPIKPAPPEPQGTGATGAPPTDSLAPEVLECVKCHERLRLNAAERQKWEYDCPFCRETFKIPRPVQASPAPSPPPAATPSPPVAPPAQAAAPSPPPTSSVPQTTAPLPPVPVAPPPAGSSPQAAASRPPVPASPARAPAPTLQPATPSLIAGYYYQENGKECGPASADDLWHMVAGDELNGDSLIRSVSSDQWIPFGELPDSAFSSTFQQAVHEYHVAHQPPLPPSRGPLPPPRRPAAGKLVKVLAVVFVLVGLLFAAVTVSEYAAGPYRWRTWLRGQLERLSPSLCSLGTQLGVVSKGDDCAAVGGQHAWYPIDEKTTGCYHCKATRPVQPPEAKTGESAAGASP